MKLYLDTLDDQSKYIRDLIDRDRLEKRDPVYLKQRKAELKAELKKLEDLEKIKPIEQEKINDCLKHWHEVFEFQTYKDKEEFTKTIEKRVLPIIKKFGYTGSSKDLCELFLNWKEG